MYNTRGLRIICVMKLSMKSLYAYKDYSAIEVLAQLVKLSFTVFRLALLIFTAKLVI